MITSLESSKKKYSISIQLYHKSSLAINLLRGKIDTLNLIIVLGYVLITLVQIAF